MRESIQRLASGLQMAWQDFSPSGRQVASLRAVADRALASLPARPPLNEPPRRVLIDATFDNPNYWLRVGLFRAALGLAGADTFGIVGPYRQRQVRSTLAHFGVNGIFDSAPSPSRLDETSRITDALLNSAPDGRSVLNWRLPCDVSPTIVYDAILKRQRLPSLDVHHPAMRRMCEEAVGRILRVEEVLDACKPDLVITSHPIGMICGPLSDIAVRRGIPVAHLFGLFGVLRFARFGEPDDLVRFYDQPDSDAIDSLPPETAARLREVGMAYLAARMDGRADDLASVYAFQKARAQVDREAICAGFGWDPNKPIVGVYASNWFDWPHQLGMLNFADFLDWTQVTVDVAKEVEEVNWLFKPHPAEAWFGGAALADIMRDMQVGSNIRLTETKWNAAKVMQSIDALVTYHGTAGIEFAGQGGAVLLPDRGKYDTSGFALLATSRDDYVAKLRRTWWKEIDREEVRRRAEVFAGWWFCAPDWQDGFVLGDDACQDALYAEMVEMIAREKRAVTHEVDCIRDWWLSGEMHYHTRKMRLADGYRLSNAS